MGDWLGRVSGVSRRLQQEGDMYGGNANVPPFPITVWHAEEDNALHTMGLVARKRRRSPASQDARLLETSHMTFTFPCHTLQASSSTRLFPVKAVPFLTDDNMPCVKCHMTRDGSHKGLPQVPARTPALRHVAQLLEVLLEN